VIGLKRQNSNLKVLLSVSGKLSKMASSGTNRKNFIHSVGKTIAEHGFDGIDLHWEYPGKNIPSSLGSIVHRVKINLVQGVFKVFHYT
jgi:GH18 family chitinase